MAPAGAFDAVRPLRLRLVEALGESGFEPGVSAALAMLSVAVLQLRCHGASSEEIRDYAEQVYECQAHDTAGMN